VPVPALIAIAIGVFTATVLLASVIGILLLETLGVFDHKAFTARGGERALTSRTLNPTRLAIVKTERPMSDPIVLSHDQLLSLADITLRGSSVAIRQIPEERRHTPADIYARLSNGALNHRVTPRGEVSDIGEIQPTFASTRGDRAF
jgi:hypothetical protein